DASAAFKDRHEQIFPGSSLGHELLPGRVHGVDERAAVLYPELLVIDDVGDELSAPLHAANLLDTGVRDLDRLFAELDPVAPGLPRLADGGQLVHTTQRRLIVGGG